MWYLQLFTSRRRQPSSYPLMRQRAVLPLCLHLNRIHSFARIYPHFRAFFITFLQPDECELNIFKICIFGYQKSYLTTFMFKTCVRKIRGVSSFTRTREIFDFKILELSTGSLVASTFLMSFTEKIFVWVRRI